MLDVVYPCLCEIEFDGLFRWCDWMTHLKALQTRNFPTQARRLWLRQSRTFFSWRLIGLLLVKHVKGYSFQSEFWVRKPTMRFWVARNLPHFGGSLVRSLSIPWLFYDYTNRIAKCWNWLQQTRKSCDMDHPNHGEIHMSYEWHKIIIMLRKNSCSWALLVGEEAFCWLASAEVILETKWIRNVLGEVKCIRKTRKHDMTQNFVDSFGKKWNVCFVGIVVEASSTKIRKHPILSDLFEYKCN